MLLHDFFALAATTNETKRKGFSLIRVSLMAKVLECEQKENDFEGM
jgi:hypothetical protein